MTEHEAPSAKSRPDADQQESAAATVDVKQLAERVYKLFCAEVRLVRARGLSQNSVTRD
jgi:hypothetical protein